MATLAQVARRMIRASISREPQSLVAQARRLALAHAERRRTADDGSHWRKAGLLWPLFPDIRKKGNR